MKTLLLVDGSSYLYRAVHALPDLRNKHQEPTGAVYGVLNMLRRLHKDYPSDYSACVFDAKGKTFRDAIYPEYKANRPPMPPDLASQIAPLLEAIRGLGWPLLMVEGVEADDVIGALAREAERENMRTVISTGDKDIAQLVNANITLVNTMSNETLDVAGVKRKFGLPPERIVDYLTLVGDSVDNVPGVHKVGPKTAVKWLMQYGTLDNLVARADEMTGVVGENLRKALDWLPTARELLTIKCDVDLPVHLPELTQQKQDTDALIALYERLEFKAWLRELTARETPPAPAPAPGQAGLFDQPQPALFGAPQTRDYETILSEDALQRWMEKIASAALVCFDTETTGLDPMTARIVGMSFAVETGAAAYLPLAHDYADAPQQLPFAATLEKMKPLLENPAIRKVGQNLKYDKHILANHDIALNGIAHDTLLQSYVLESHRQRSMDDLALRHLGARTITYEEITGKGVKQMPFSQVALAQAAEYAAEDADITLQLHESMYPRIAANAKLDHVYRNIEMPVLEILFRMERAGVLLNGAMLQTQSHELGCKLLALEQQAHELAGQPFNLGSTKQLQEILFGKLGIKPLKKTPGGTPSTDEDVLQELALDHPLPKVLLEYRGLSKLKSTYTDKLPKMVNPATGRVHTNYSQAVAVTGRLASNDPNLQNIPVRTAEGRRIREAFIAPPDHVIVSADYSQIELRIMAHLSQDASLLAAFAAGEDIHRATAAEIFACDRVEVSHEQRRYAKVINFGLIYGMSAFGLASTLNIERAAAQSYIERYFARYPGVRAYMDETRMLARQQGYVETVFGRRLWVSEINSPNVMRRQAAERAAINAPMQGTAADLIKLAMIAVDNWLREQKIAARMVMQVHDELVLEVPQTELALIQTELPRLMSGVAQLDVPLEVEIGTGANWESAH
ncbi:MAG: DNA polymerase I [Methylobacillus sp.]|jgi:DNA polymerase-1|nr:DNA polymerase I [Methylobacillus sp.]